MKTCFGVLLLRVTSLITITLQADGCIIGVIGESVRLPCIYKGVKNVNSVIISSEWRRDVKVIHSTQCMQHQDTQHVFNGTRTAVSSSAAKSGDFTLELRDVQLSDAHNYSCFLKLFGQENKYLICTVCLTVAGHFNHPTLHRENTVNGEETQLICNTKGGFPAPNIYWLVNRTQRPQESAVLTYVNALPQSALYNVTSVLYVNVSPQTTVSCVIENYLLNETFTATNCGVKSSLADGRPSEFMWIFSTVLCVVVFLLVAASLCFQKKLDRNRKKELHRCGDDSSSEGTEMIIMDMDQWDFLPETIV